MLNFFKINLEAPIIMSHIYLQYIRGMLAISQNDNEVAQDMTLNLTTTYTSPCKQSFLLLQSFSFLESWLKTHIIYHVKEIILLTLQHIYQWLLMFRPHRSFWFQWFHFFRTLLYWIYMYLNNHTYILHIIKYIWETDSFLT